MASLTLSCFAFTALGCGTAHQRTEAPATVTYLHQGVSPGPVMITDAEGQVVTERRYEPFGSPIDSLGRDGQVISGTDFHVEPWNSLNKETDPRTGWSYHGARWMSPGTGRWLSPDPPTKAPDAAFLAAPWDLNPYQYVRQNPALYWDPNGEEWTRSEVAFAEWILASNGVKNPTVNETFHQLAESFPHRPEAQAYLQAAESANFYVKAPWKALEYATYLEGGIAVAQSAKAFVSRAAGTVTHAGETVVSWVKGLFSRGASDVARSVERVQRVMSRAEFEATQATGLVRGGREGTHYVTPAASSSALRARQRLALPQTPEIRATLEVPAGTFSPATRVESRFNMPGGGLESTATGNVPARVVDWEALK